MESQGFYSRIALGVSFAGYGKTDNDLDYKFLQLGTAVNQNGSNFDLHFIPVSYRPFSKILPNTYLGVGAGAGSSGKTYFLNTSVGF
jgi:hypothetical protein